jgi:hypothetical protein
MVVNPFKFVVGEDEKSPAVRGFIRGGTKYPRLSGQANCDFRSCRLAGLVYWYALYLIHRWIFSSMLRSIAVMAER